MAAQRINRTVAGAAAGRACTRVRRTRALELRPGGTPRGHRGDSEVDVLSTYYYM